MEEHTTYLRKSGPLEHDDELLKNYTDLPLCAACGRMFREGDLVGMLSIGPGEDPHEQAKARGNQPYNAVQIPLHWICATGKDW